MFLEIWPIHTTSLLPQMLPNRYEACFVSKYDTQCHLQQQCNLLTQFSKWMSFECSVLGSLCDSLIWNSLMQISKVGISAHLARLISILSQTAWKFNVYINFTWEPLKFTLKDHWSLLRVYLCQLKIWRFTSQFAVNFTAEIAQNTAF